jgi:hypothetical protein
MMSQFAAQAFAKNRAEELGFDLSEQFVLPLFYNKLALNDVRKPLLIEGGRGCGKTTLLRYLSHRTQLSATRALNLDNLPREIGLYLRADTQYLRAFAGDALSAQDWQRAFEHSLCLNIMGEFLSALSLLAHDSQRRTDFPGIDNLDLRVIKDFDSEAGTTLPDLRNYVLRQKNRLAAWLNNQEGDQRPRFLPLKQTLLALIVSTQEQLPFLVDVVFFVFIDEYENLLLYQMKAINTLLKHSEPPLIFHIATKRNGMATRETLGTEQLQEPDDYRKVDIEEHLSQDFALFAAELFCFRLLKKDGSIGDTPVNAGQLTDPDQIDFRRDNQDYRRAVKQVVSAILPGTSPEALAALVLNDGSLRTRLLKLISEGLGVAGDKTDPSAFIRPSAATASLCCPALLHQGKPAGDILDELSAFEAGTTSKFAGDAGWIHHYLIGSLLHLYLPLQRPCPLYAGFDAFLRLSRGNVRHFLELCHLSLLELDHDPKPGETVPVEKQASAARTASALFVKETQGSGDHGNRLFLIVNTLGQIFRLSQQRPSQSEAERTHFFINGDIPTTAEDILKECVKWSVLFVTRETKVKEPRFEGDEYVLNPIYAPYFGISYNKGRKLELGTQAALDLLVGSRDRLDTLVKAYRRNWLVSDDQLPLL